jgi:hypothetical protein
LHGCLAFGCQPAQTVTPHIAALFTPIYQNLNHNREMGIRTRDTTSVNLKKKQKSGTLSDCGKSFHPSVF